MPLTFSSSVVLLIVKTGILSNEKKASYHSNIL